MILNIVENVINIIKYIKEDKDNPIIYKWLIIKYRKTDDINLSNVEFNKI